MTRITRAYPWLVRARPLVALLPLALALLLTACGGSGSSGGSGY